MKCWHHFFQGFLVAFVKYAVGYFISPPFKGFFESFCLLVRVIVVLEPVNPFPIPFEGIHFIKRYTGLEDIKQGKAPPVSNCGFNKLFQVLLVSCKPPLATKLQS